MFTTEYGVASLVLKEIPYKEIAFVHVRTVVEGCLKDLLEECTQFCRAAGAERIFATGDEELASCPLHCIVYKMSGTNSTVEAKASLWPVTGETVGKWREIYNERMHPFENHATMTAWDEKEIVNSAGAYFVHRDGKLLGIGWMNGDELLALCAVEPGMGETVARALFSTTDSDRITLEVVSTNERAIRLYQRMGFVITEERTRWYRIR